MILILYLGKGLYRAIEAEDRLGLKQQEESEQCLVKYQKNECNLENLSEVCRGYLNCMKRRPPRLDGLEYLQLIVGNTISSISSDLIGPIMLSIVAFLMKLLQVITRR